MSQSKMTRCLELLHEFYEAKKQVTEAKRRLEDFAIEIGQKEGQARSGMAPAFCEGYWMSRKNAIKAVQSEAVGANANRDVLQHETTTTQGV